MGMHGFHQACLSFIIADIVLVIHRYFGTSTWWLSSLLTLYWLFIGTSVLQRGGFHHCWPCTGYSSVLRYFTVVAFITADLVLVIHRYFGTSTWWLSSLLTLYWLFIGTSELQRGGFHHCWPCTGYSSVLRYFNVVAFITADLVLVIHRYFGTSTWWLSSLLTLYWLFIGTSVLKRGGFHHCWPCTRYSSVLQRDCRTYWTCLDRGSFRIYTRAGELVGTIICW